MLLTTDNNGLMCGVEYINARNIYITSWKVHACGICGALQLVDFLTLMHF